MTDTEYAAHMVAVAQSRTPAAPGDDSEGGNFRVTFLGRETRYTTRSRAVRAARAMVQDRDLARRLRPEASERPAWTEMVARLDVRSHQGQPWSFECHIRHPDSSHR